MHKLAIVAAAAATVLCVGSLSLDRAEAASSVHPRGCAARSRTSVRSRPRIAGAGIIAGIAAIIAIAGSGMGAGTAAWDTVTEPAISLGRLSAIW
jgi:hypothetical protein